MNLVCKVCGNEFYNWAYRSVCYRCRPHPWVSIEVIGEDYISGLTHKQISVKRGISEGVVIACVHACGVQGRNFSREFPGIQLDQEWVDGWLLGDGSIGLPSGCNVAFFKHGSSKEGYTRYVVDNWVRMGFEVRRSIKPYVHKDGRVGYFCNSRAHPTITKQYIRWYPNGIKRIPGDVRMSPKILREWYYGDGTFIPRKGTRSSTLTMCVGGILSVEVEFLLGLLRSVFGPKVYYYEYPVEGKNKSGGALEPKRTFHFSTYLTQDFFSYIGPCTLPCYSYKWPSLEAV